MGLALRLGPALKIYAHVERLQTRGDTLLWGERSASYRRRGWTLVIVVWFVDSPTLLLFIGRWDFCVICDVIKYRVLISICLCHLAFVSFVTWHSYHLLCVLTAICVLTWWIVKEMFWSCVIMN